MIATRTKERLGRLRTPRQRKKKRRSKSEAIDYKKKSLDWDKKRKQDDKIRSLYKKILEIRTKKKECMIRLKEYKEKEIKKEMYHKQPKIVDRGQGFDNLDRIQRLKLFTRGKIGEQKRKEFLKDLQRRSKANYRQRKTHHRETPKVEIRPSEGIYNYNGMRNSFRGGSYRMNSSYNNGSRDKKYRSSQRRKNNSFEHHKNFNSDQNQYNNTQNKSFDLKQFRKNSSLKKNHKHAPTFNDILNKARNYRHTNYSRYRPDSRREYLTYEKSRIDPIQIQSLEKDSLIALRATIDKRLTELVKYEKPREQVMLRPQREGYREPQQPSFSKKEQSSIVKTIKIPRRRGEDKELVEENFHINIKTSQKKPYSQENESEYRIIEQSRHPVPQDEVMDQSFITAAIEEREEGEEMDPSIAESKGSSMVYRLLDHTEEDEDEILDTSPSELEIKNYIHEHYENSLM